MIDYQNISLDYRIVFWSKCLPDPLETLWYEVIVNGNDGSVKEVNQVVVANGAPFNLQPVLITLIVSVAILVVIIGIIFLRKKQGQKDK